MADSFGARLRQRREERGIALATIAEQTKIKLSLLEALERDDVSHWPTGIFRRAYIRAYAQAIGQNPDVVVREFLEVHPAPDEVVETFSAIASATDRARPDAGPPTRLRNIVRSALGSLSSRRNRGAVEAELEEAHRVNEPAAAEAEVHAAVGRLPAAARSDHPATTAEAPPSTIPQDVDYMAVARVCTELGRAETRTDVQRALQDSAKLLDATGLIAWVWDELYAELRPALVHGYSDKVIAQLPTVTPDSDNATAAAFRSGETCAVHGRHGATGALAVPLLTPAGCAGVLAIELQHGGEQKNCVVAAATILAAVLAQLIGGSGR
jgi:cytoskeletal protein RodZ